ncbi:MAG: hypothetical protein KGH94_04720 [Candidatus Micrarchaeota archaeon]|nr:hypothetical protein [Candidatus Micrarchaeota archaeon]
MSLEEIRKSIDKDARTRSESIREEGASEASAIIKEAKERASEVIKTAKAEAEKEAERIRREQVSGTQIEVNSMLVNARESVLERHMPSLKKGVASRLSGKNLDKILAGAAKQFSRFSAKEHMVVRTGKSNAAAARKLGYPVVSGREGELTLEAKDGSVSVDASPSGLAERHAADARGLLAAKLWKVKG